MSVEGLQYRWRDEGTIAGVQVGLTAGDPIPAMPLSQTTGLLAVDILTLTTVTLWSAATSALTSFDTLYVMTGDYPSVDGLDGDGTTAALAGQLELTCNDGANERIWFEQLRAGFPYRRFSNVGVDSTSVADVIDLIRFVNNTTGTLTVRYFLAKA